MLDLELFDLETYLVQKGIHYTTHGKNVSSGWLGVQCPFCFDQSNHLGINVTTKSISCWKCGTSGSVIKYLAEALNLNVNEILNEIEKYSTRVYKSAKPAILKQNLSKYDIKNIVKYQAEDVTHFRQYLESRNFNPEQIEKQYGVFYSGPLGRYANRIIIPITMFKRELSFITRAIVKGNSPKYLSPSAEEVPLTVKECVYNYDTIEDTAIIVEGPMDVWNIGAGSICVFGVKYSTFQLKLLKKLNRAFMLFDPEKEAQEMALKMAQDLAIIVPHVELVEYEKGDPAEMPLDDVKHLRKYIFGKIY